MSDIRREDLDKIIEDFDKSLETIETQIKNHADTTLDEMIKKLETAFYQRIGEVESSELKTIMVEWLNENYRNEFKLVLPEKTFNVSMDGKHSSFQECFTTLCTFKKLRMVGPAGSGKSTVAEQLAAELNLPFYKMGCNSEIEESHFVGYLDKDNNPVIKTFITAYTGGGVFFLDEMDRLPPGAAITLNTVLDSSQRFYVDYQDEPFEKHPDFYVVAAGNTWGKGSVEYTAAEYQDMAFLDRWRLCTVEVGYDAALERHICGDEETYGVMTSIREVLEHRGSYFSTRNMVDLLQLSHVMGSKRAAVKRMIADEDDQQTILDSIEFDGVTDLDVETFLSE